MNRLMAVHRQLAATTVAPAASPALSAAADAMQVEDYTGQVVVVTGAGGGIGSRIAVRFASAGAALALCDQRPEELATTEKECRAAGCDRLFASTMDVADELAVKEFCRDTAKALGGVDCLINTVGIVDCFGDVEELPIEEWERVMRVNVTSAFLTAKFTVPLMRNRGGGAVINVSSASGLANQRKAMVYSVSKAALISLTKSEAIDFAQDNIRANAILPGSVDTPLLDTVSKLEAERNSRTQQEQLDYWSSDYPTKRKR